MFDINIKAKLCTVQQAVPPPTMAARLS